VLPGQEKLAGVPEQEGPSSSLPPMQVSAVQVPEYTEMRLFHADVPHKLAVWMFPVTPDTVYHTPPNV
jgi:hypothetical protein